MNLFKSEKFQKIFTPIFYLIFTIAVTISGCYIFSRYYYTNIFVDGESMMPTLVGNNYHHYGIADTTDAAINNLKRFDVLITVYPHGWGSTDDSLIVKRVWGFPGETLSLTTSGDITVFTVTSGNHTEEYTGNLNIVKANLITEIQVIHAYTFNVGNRVFNLKSDTEKRSFNVTLGQNEYFVMGDNWDASNDSYRNLTSPNKLTRSHLRGKVVCIQGYGHKTGTSGNYQITNKHKIEPMYRF